MIGLWAYSNTRDCPNRFASFRDSRSFKDVLLNAAPKVLRPSLLDKRGKNISGYVLETRKSEVLGSEESFFMTGVSTHEVEVEVVSIHPKPAVSLDPKWQISIKKEKMNWFRYSLVGYIKSMYVLLNAAPKVLRPSLLDKRGKNISGYVLETRKSEVLGSEESFFMTGVSTHEVEVEVVSIHPKPAVALDPKWQISIKKEKMNWFRYSLMGYIKSMYTQKWCRLPRERMVSRRRCAHGLENNGRENVELVESQGKSHEHVAINLVGSSLSKCNLHEVQVISVTNLVIDGSMTCFVHEGSDDGLPISHDSRLQDIDVGLFDAGRKVGSTTFNNKGDLASVYEFISRPVEPNPEGLEANKNWENLLNTKAIDSKREGEKRGAIEFLLLQRVFSRISWLVNQL
ncbi:hypothetical protein V6N11_071672 [Hibiscus sabdariffa]|uniref:Uncharacterized protein n=1 Tax=Hibiscus sabdariffa TaxID=183260 RepID=A0ABR2U1G2_9ROSI